jgi:hypothetical protein
MSLTRAAAGAAVTRSDAERTGIETPDHRVRALPNRQRPIRPEFSPAPLLPDLKLEPAMAFFGFWLALIASQTCFGVGRQRNRTANCPQTPSLKTQW